MKTLNVLFLLVLMIAPGLVLAEHEINFSVTEYIDVENDLLVVQFMAQHQAENSKQVTNEINRLMKNAINRLNSQQRQYVQTGQYSLQPQYNKDHKISHWQGQQLVTVTLPKAADVGDILTALQQDLIYQSMRMDVSLEQRKQAENQLLDRAIAQYQAQAKSIAKSFGVKRFKLIETHIQNLATPGRPQARMLMAADIAPTIEMGQQTLSLQINGTLELK